MSIKISKIKFLLVTGIFIMAILLVIVFAKIKSQTSSDELLYGEITRMIQVTIERNLTLDDLKTMEKLSAGIKPIEENLKTMRALIGINNAEHASHGLAFINLYIQTGRYQVCIPHEIEHLGLFLEGNDMDMAFREAELIKANFKTWEEKSEKARINFPAYYQNLNEVKTKVNDILESYANKVFDEEFFDNIEYVSENGVC